MANNFRELGIIGTVLFVLGSVLMVVGLGVFVFLLRNVYGAVCFLCGAVLFAVMQCMQTYSGDDFTLRRLKNMMNLADLLFVLAGILLLDTSTQFLRGLFSNVMVYFNYIYNKWLIVLLVAVMLELYSVNRISYKLRRMK